jgi:proteasome lid subunit RPN8/RPN11
MSLVLPAALADEIKDHAERGYPHEVCGLLLGVFDGEDDRRAVEVYALDNERVDSRENRYAVSGHSMFLAEKHARAMGLDIVGYYHSHPNAPARPSGYDLDHATWPNISYPIVSVADGRAADLRSWVLAEDRSEFGSEPIDMR